MYHMHKLGRHSFSLQPLLAMSKIFLFEGLFSLPPRQDPSASPSDSRLIVSALLCLKIKGDELSGTAVATRPVSGFPCILLK